jgi:hypothetical protein
MKFIVKRLVPAAVLLVVLYFVANMVIKNWSNDTDVPLVQVFNVPDTFSRRYGDFTANICGSISKQARGAQWRLNNGQWVDVGTGWPRVELPLFVIEIPPEMLREGMNAVEIMASAKNGKTQTTKMEFKYDPSPISLPASVDWSNTDLDVEEGYWETFYADSEWRVRPKPGYEGYDKIIVVTGAFGGGRRVKTDLIFRNKWGEPDWDYGFGVLPMWGGRPDDRGISLRRGWNFGLAWWYSRYQGAGMEFSYKHGDASPAWVSSYRNFTIEPNVRYYVTVESWAEQDKAGNHLRYRQRMKWWRAGDTEPREWMKLTDVEGAPIPHGEYGVALIAYHCQVDFGPVVVEPL